jgi:hypothetical protein
VNPPASCSLPGTPTSRVAGGAVAATQRPTARRSDRVAPFRVARCVEPHGRGQGIDDRARCRLDPADDHPAIWTPGAPVAIAVDANLLERRPPRLFRRDESVGHFHLPRSVGTTGYQSTQ